MAADYYIREPIDESEALERWENEGGRPRQHDEAHYIAVPRGSGEDER